MTDGLTTVLLDIDGTLLDSNDAHAKAWTEALERVGHPVPFEEIRRLIGMGGDNLLAAIGLSEEGEPGKSAAALRKDIFRRLLPELTPTPGTRDLLIRMRDAGLGRVVATSASSGELGPLLEQAGIVELVEAATSADDAARSKPDPDIVQAALRRADAAPHEAILLGDTPWDLKAARRAGVGFVGVRSGGWRFDDADGALAVYDDPRDLLRHWTGSPFSLRP